MSSSLLSSPLAEAVDLRVIVTHVVGTRRRRLAVFLRALARLACFCLGAGPRVVHLHATVRGSLHRKVICVLLARTLRTPVILHVHAGAGELRAFADRLGRLRRPALLAGVRAATRVVAVSVATAEVLERDYGVTKVDVVPNPVAVPPLPPQRHVFRPGAPTVLYLGGFANPVKGASVLLEAAAELRTTRPGLRFVLAGPGEPYPEAGLDGSDNLEWRGWLDAAGRHRELAQADVLVLPSLSEGLPMALLEAMAAELAVVASEVGGIPEVVSDARDGLLVPPGDAPALAKALSGLADDPERAAELGRAARRRVADLAPDRVAARLEALYRELTDGPP